MSPLDLARRSPSWLAPVAVAAAMGAVSPLEWREGVVLLVAAVMAFAVRGRPWADLVLGFGFAIVAAAGVSRGGGLGGLVVLAASAGAVVAMTARPSRWPPLLLPAVGLGGALAVAFPLLAARLGRSVCADGALERWPLVVAAAAAALLLFTRKSLAAPRRALALALALSALKGPLALIQARAALAASSADPGGGSWEEALRLSRRAGWSDGERRVRLGRARALLSAADPAGALALLGPEVALDASTLYARSEALRAVGRGTEAMQVLKRALDKRPPEAGELSADGLARAGMWEARAGRFAVARVHLAQAEKTDEPARFLAELSAVERAAGDAALSRRAALRATEFQGDSWHAVCALAEAEPTALDRARACRALVPNHRPSLEALAGSGDAEARAALAGLTDLPAMDVSFGGVVRLKGARVTSEVVRPGGAMSVELAWEVEGTCARREGYLVFMQLFGTRSIGADHVMPEERHSPSWVRGERFRYRHEVRIPPDAPAGRYSVGVGVLAPEARVMLTRSDAPSHIRFVQLGVVEVSP